MKLSPAEIFWINVPRIVSWCEKLKKEHAIAVILLGVGQDHNSGKLVVSTSEDLKEHELDAIIEALPALYQEYKASRGGHSARTP